MGFFLKNYPFCDVTGTNRSSSKFLKNAETFSDFPKKPKKFTNLFKSLTISGMMIFFSYLVAVFVAFVAPPFVALKKQIKFKNNSIWIYGSVIPTLRERQKLPMELNFLKLQFTFFQKWKFQIFHLGLNRKHFTNNLKCGFKWKNFNLVPCVRILVDRLCKKMPLALKNLNC